MSGRMRAAPHKMERIFGTMRMCRERLLTNVMGIGPQDASTHRRSRCGPITKLRDECNRNYVMSVSFFPTEGPLFDTKPA